MMCRYEELVTRPADVMRQMYRFINLSYPGDHIVQDIHPQSVGKGRQSKLSAEVDELCASMLKRLENSQRAAAPVAQAERQPLTERALIQS
jgi:hypothetical protein